ncbi:hypothetical protein E6P09_11765 [Haloferax mediterranei ATCC 33500]|uniref:Uncharacterized protein n=1 Tax=Haloferax mediterranei (strain ATCC 33500 / DSM 1411 / JCM 8866 / NBRC 14739 / NCIMB 2177 / R-4) TaxID=523841 RepID=I3R5E3_HALMT|nr:hypothetical protein [Haloferax mediterranei]AFK19453.1 hypothetical protein HFX_1747 [Haloferax mediterranei ATCC 33500]AHZ21200.1 hypothetical protein BM92_00380 [Haloferax mediterranei ATCC 33500]EMA04360.1 hypothetical protein C439_01757 [Haloferax mediterranei ATCC 33500]MDX5989555.1 hypothetical protein [Haloferax mediterranei ATCC 33500]QCQ75913.1 hypothetical protein E6P09_11765 [Haloferax mediterranei ATCC 33500]
MTDEEREPAHYILDSDDYGRDVETVFSEVLPLAHTVRVELDRYWTVEDDGGEQCAAVLSSLKSLGPERPDDRTYQFALNEEGTDVLFALLDVAQTFAGSSFVFRLKLLDETGAELLQTIPHESSVSGKSPPLPAETVGSIQSALADRTAMFVEFGVRERWETDEYAYRLATTDIVESSLDGKTSRTLCSALTTNNLRIQDGTTLVFDTWQGEKIVHCVTPERAERVAEKIRELRRRYDGHRL